MHIGGFCSHKKNGRLCKQAARLSVRGSAWRLQVLLPHNQEAIPHNGVKERHKLEMQSAQSELRGMDWRLDSHNHIARLHMRIRFPHKRSV